MRYADIRKMDIVNGEGIGVSLFVQGCPFHCKGCFNTETWDFNGGKKFTKEICNKFVQLCEQSYVDFIAILGGEPLEQGEDLYSLLKEIKEKLPNKPIFLWTGYKWENIKYDIAWKTVTEFVDVLIEGQFEEEKKDLTLAFRGSTNQRVIDVKKTLDNNNIPVLYCE